METHRWKKVNLHCPPPPPPHARLNTLLLSKSRNIKGHSDHRPDHLITEKGLASFHKEVPNIHSRFFNSFVFYLAFLFFIFFANSLGFLRATLLVLVLMASFHWSALDTEKERWCMLSLLPPNASAPVCREMLLLE